MLKIENLKLQFGKKLIFHDVNTVINDGDVVGIIGPSGCGKSTFLRSMMMLEHPTSGHIYLGDEDITSWTSDHNEARERIGMVFQDFNLFKHLSIIENVVSGMIHVQGMDRQEAYDEGMKILKEVGLIDKAFMYPSDLSGGQQQRAAIARTLAMKPEIVLLDEPTSALDPLVRGEVESVIRMMAASGHTMVIVSHEMELIKQVCNRVIFFNDGGIFEEGTPKEIFENASKDETRRFVYALKVLELNVDSKDFDFIGSQTQITEFCYKNGVSKALLDRLLAIQEELFQMVIIQPHEQNSMHMVFEYNQKEKELFGSVEFTGEPFDEDDPMYFVSWPIIKMRSTSIETLPAEAPYTNLFKMTIKDK